MFDQFLDISQLLSNLTFVDIFNFSIYLVFTVCYTYQLFYVVVVLLRKPPKLEATKNHRYAVMIAARNEQTVIADLIHSIKVQNYPQELIDVFVIADNCTDDTAEVARTAGAIVFPRHNDIEVGKGYALDYGYQAIREFYGDRGYEAFFVFDADNVLDVNYFREMNKTFDSGAQVSTSYRNSKNFDSNWISAGYALWFLREAKYLNQARITLNTSCLISGTGFYIASEILEEAGGWKWHLLTEDIEFSSVSIIQGTRISYCPTARLYDEQPITFRDSWNQRLRWAKGFLQVFANYAGKLAIGTFTHPRGQKFACYDMLMTISPVTLLTVISIIFNATILILGACGVLSPGMMLVSAGTSLFFCVFNYGLLMFVLGVVTTLTEWDEMRASTKAKVWSMFTFPAFMLTYVPITLTALFKKTTWKPIHHSITVDVGEFAEASNAKFAEGIRRDL